MLIIFCSTTLFKKKINYRDISDKLILETFTSSSSFFNSSNLKGEIPDMLFHCPDMLFHCPDMLFHCRTRWFFGEGGGGQKELLKWF